MCIKMFPIHRVRSRRGVSSRNRPPSKIRRTSELLRSDARSIRSVPRNTSASHFLQYYTKRSIRSSRSSKLTILQLIEYELLVSHRVTRMRSTYPRVAVRVMANGDERRRKKKHPYNLLAQCAPRFVFEDNPSNTVQSSMLF